MAGSATETVRRREGTETGSHAVAGVAKPGFEAVREAFIENFERRGELGAACCVYYRGEKVVDLWGGIRNKATGEPWEADTMALVHSTTKGMAGLAMALAHSRGLLDYDERVSTYWPEFAQQGKERITVRQLLSHQAGLFALDERPVRSLVADPDRLAAVLARQKPVWPPGTRQAYHAITLGFYESELLRRVDPEHRTLGRFFQEELATPLGLEFYIRLPEEIPDSRLAPLHRFDMAAAIFALPVPLALAAMNPRSRFRRALLGSELPEQSERVYARNLEVPAGGGVGTARAMARAYSVFATGGRELGLREETLRQLMAPAVPPARGFRDACLKVEIQFSLGFAKPGPTDPFAHPSSFGHPGTGGSFGLADPHAEVGYAYIPNQMGAHLEDPREAALRRAMYRSIGETNPYRP
ncbi:serine hydrolase domain-containing protein [Anaeromyxobacter oryzae]|uniref:Esterase n=1 Tax=Anaeromyxobacter oryzae TaxID=2918170 RepID=A0ABM7X1J3_9BACT|nr:serine hydrolase domain-containing protein [Anaeromyxobacter oryzae]BDG05658.1 esterase [Anaeromyxobacter oryzae]